MKRISIVFAMFIFLFLCSSSSAIDVTLEPYVKGGGLKLEEKGIVEGHKFILAGGMKAILTTRSVFQGIIAAEKWQMGEGLDEDTEIPKKGDSISVGIEYRAVKNPDVVLYPYAGIVFEEIERARSNADITGSWTSLRFFRCNLGAKIILKEMYARVVILFPFAIDTNRESQLKTRLGYEAEAGIKIWRELSTSWFYRQLRYGNPHTSISINGLLFSYQF